MPDDLDWLMAAIDARRTTYASPMDRYREFRQVFGTDAGQRVLREILVMGRMFRSPVVTGDTHATYLCLGEHNFAMKIYNCATVEPPARVERQQSTEPKE